MSDDEFHDTDHDIHEDDPGSVESSERTTNGGAFRRFRTWASVIGGVLTIGTAIWRTVAYLDDLHETIQHNASEAVRLWDAHEEYMRNHEDQMRRLVTAVRGRAERDQEVVTQLRIAVAALEAAVRVRSGRGSYAGLASLGAVGQVSGNAISSPPAPARSRLDQEEQASNDVRRALKQSVSAQLHQDPLAELDGM